MIAHESNVSRINGIKVNWQQTSDQEVLNMVFYMQDRVTRTQTELGSVVLEAMSRGLIDIEQLPSRELPETA